ncbi:hypothetical protein VNI00_010681 [Paramarasmius palmivorus]|uniref:F-box domain-containing protein n=1 Tax=Paramarasmius palmivorus TaxID=297713 RepID=A0AAW0CM47_9AGAR
MNPETVNPEYEPAVHRLPPELLLSIFRLASPATGLNIHPSAIRNQAPWKVGRVCRRWRTIIENSPELWSILVLDRKKLPDSAEAPFWKHFAEIFDILSRRSAGRQHLELRLVDTATSSRSDVVGRRISQSFLACLFNRQIDIQPVVPWEHITVFHLSKYRLEYLYQVLRKCDNLQELVLGERDLEVYDSTASWGSGVRLNSLRTLKLVVHRTTEHSRVLQILTLPGLERLEIVLKDPEYGKMVLDVTLVLEMLARSGCTLKALVIKNLRYQVYVLDQFLKYVSRLEELVLEGDVSGCVVEKFVARLVGLKKLVIRCTPCTKSGVGLPPPIDGILGAVRGMSRLQSLEVQARVPRHMWGTGDQMDELRSRDVEVREDYREPVGKDMMMMWCREIICRLCWIFCVTGIHDESVRDVECAVIDNVVTLLRDRSVFPAEAFQELPNPEKDPSYAGLERFWGNTLRMPGVTFEKIRALVEEWPKETGLDRPFRFGNEWPYYFPSHLRVSGCCYRDVKDGRSNSMGYH